MKKTFKLTLICQAPQGTLGDYSAALQFLSAIEIALKKREYLPQINLFLIIAPAYVDRIKKFKLPETSKLTILSENYPTHQSREVFFDNNPILHNSDLIVLYPTFWCFTTKMWAKIDAYHKKVLVGFEYDIDFKCHQENKNGKQEPIERKIETLPFAYYFGTGFGPDFRQKKSLGIYIQNLQNFKKHLSDIDDKNDVLMRDFLLKDYQTEMQYFQETQLFFGYFNHLKSNRTLLNATSFVVACLAQPLSLKTDIVINMDENDFEELMTQLKKHCEPVEKYSFTLYHKSAGGYEIKKHQGDGAYQIRIINGFQLSHETMHILYHVSEPFCLVTGDGSFSEAISHAKVLGLQVMPWKNKSFFEFIKHIENFLGPHSLLAEFFAKQAPLTTAREDREITRIGRAVEIGHFITQHKKTLIQQMHAFTAFLLKDYNLHQNIEDVLLPVVDNFPEIILQNLFEIQPLSFYRVEGFLSLYPTMVENVYQKIIEYKLEEDLLRAESLVVKQSLYPYFMENQDLQWRLLLSMLENLPNGEEIDDIEFYGEIKCGGCSLISLNNIFKWLAAFSIADNMLQLRLKILKIFFLDDEGQSYISVMLAEENSIQHLLDMIQAFNTPEGKLALFQFLFYEVHNTKADIYKARLIKAIFDFDAYHDIKNIFLLWYADRQDEIIQYLQKHHVLSRHSFFELSDKAIVLDDNEPHVFCKK